MDRRRVVVIGSGNVATHIARAIDAHHDVVQVYSRNKHHAADLSQRLRHCTPIDRPEEITPNADLYVVSVNDDAIRQVSASLPGTHGVVVHTSGSVGIDALSGHSHYGVLYPLQTFSRDADVDVSQVPFFVEASDTPTLELICEFAHTLSQTVYQADSAQRATLHIAAVFGCNFVNHMLTIADDLLSQEGYPLQILRPLLQVTIDKAMTLSPSASQTGPAMRRDSRVIANHMDKLSGHDRDIYRVVTESIIDRHAHRR